MTPGEFAVAMVAVRRLLKGSVTSAGRTDAHAVAVGGFAGDPHTFDLGADLVYDAPLDLPYVQGVAAMHGLRVLRETGKPHDHFQPADFPAGPTRVYAGITKDWA